MRRLAGRLLVDGASYPWSVPDLRAADLSEEAVDRLVSAGWLRETTANSYEVFHDRLLIVAGKQSPYARKRRLSLADLADAHWVVGRNELEPGSPLVAALEGAQVAAPTRVIRSGSLHTRYRLLPADGRFITLVPDSLLAFSPQAAAQLKVLPVELPMWSSPTMIITIRGRALPPAAGLFIDTLRQMAKTFKGAVGKAR